MDTTLNSKKPLSLEQILTSYNLLILFFIIFIILMIILFQLNKKGFDNIFGYQIFITGPVLLILALLIKELISFKSNPESSWFSSFSVSKMPLFIPGITISLIIYSIASFFVMLYVGGVFSENPPENNIETFVNFVIIILFLIITGFIYKNSKDKDDNIIKTFSKPIQDIFYLRTKYTLLLIGFILCTVLLYLLNPWDIMTNYGNPVIFFTLFIGIIFTILITIYHKFLANPLQGEKRINEIPSFLSFILKSSYILGALAISGGLIFLMLKMIGIFDQNASNPKSWGHIILNLVLFCAMLGIIFKLINAGGFLDKNPLYRLILNTLLYIPCLIVSIPNYIIGLFSNIPISETPSKPYEIKILMISLGLLTGYFLWVILLNPFIKETYLKQGGEQLVNHPISTDELSDVASYEYLSGINNVDYRYAMSFWVYIDALPPSTNSSYMKVVPILSYGENPGIKYSSESNTLFITVKQEGGNSIEYNKKELNTKNIEEWKNNKDIHNSIENVKSMSFSNKLDSEGNRLIYEHPNVLLQKWNHIVLNYNGGTLDVFYNGKLVKSEIEVVPYIKYDMLTIGTENGIKGSVANLLYFKEPLDILTIHTLYTSLKDKNPPSI